jgi:hypothetical protein
VKRYLGDQLQRHAMNRIVDRLERITVMEHEAKAEQRETP